MHVYLFCMTDGKDTTVLYNADCPVCNFEISHYSKYAGDNNLAIRFDDLNSDALTQWGLSAEDAAKRLHVAKDGQVLSGIPAFLVLWQDMPRYRILARLVGLPVINQIACVVYDYALAPILYRMHLKRTAQASTQ